MVGDGDAMRIARQIVQHMFGATEGRLGIDDPVLPIERAQEDGEALVVVERHALTEEAQLIAGKETPQSSDELAAEYTTEDLDWEQEAVTGRDPAGVIFRESATGHQAVDVRMWSERLSPGVQDGQEAEFCAEMRTTAFLSAEQTRKMPFGHTKNLMRRSPTLRSTWRFIPRGSVQSK